MESEKETKVKYLYGASVQGIQDFIFQTNKLKEIVGGSELVEQICTTAFDEYALKKDGEGNFIEIIGNKKGKKKEYLQKGQSIVRAAGNIKCILNEADCKKAVSEFPRKVMTMAPGVTISQSVVLLKDDLSDYAERSQELEQNLRAQRSKATRPMNLGLMAIKRAPSTGLPGIEYAPEGEDKEKKLIDKASKLKRDASNNLKLAKKAFGEDISKKNLALEIEEITDTNNWIAVIHADGNGLGQIFQSIGENPGDMSLFSSTLDKITMDCVRVAFEQVRSLYFRNQPKIPMRPVVLGGDDLTMICRADIAIEFTQAFLELFETFSKTQLEELDVRPESKQLLKKGLTACAGIAFIKASYPFHYAVTLAEALCKQAKDKTKALVKDSENPLPPSCLMFYKVQDSFVEDFSEIRQRALTPQANISFEYGPYYCGERAEEVRGKDCSEHTINLLNKHVAFLKEDEVKGLKGNLRNWLTLLYEDVGKANQRMQRICDLKGDNQKEEFKDLALTNYTHLGEREDTIFIPFYDILSLASLDIVTKKEEDKK